MHQYALAGKGKTIHSTGQLEWYKHDVNHKSIKVGGLQCSKTFYAYVIPLDFKSGLPYMTIRPYTDDEWENLPHLILTSDENGNPQSSTARPMAIMMNGLMPSRT